MNKTLLAIFLMSTLAGQSQNLLTENFDLFPAVSAPGTPDQWVRTNQSTPSGAGNWIQGGGNQFSTAHSGSATSYARVTYESVTGNGTISNWLISPVVNLKNGDVISFWSRQGGTGSMYADRMEVRLDNNWTDSSTLPATGADDLANFTVECIQINPGLDPAGYPLVWTNYTYTVTNMPTEAVCRIAFRYFVTNGGTLGTNSNTIAIDSFTVDRSLGTANFFAEHFAIYPNPVASDLNVHTKSDALIDHIQLTDLNGRVVKNIDAGDVSEIQINIADLNSGVYFLKISSDTGVGTSKFIKN